MQKDNPKNQPSKIQIVYATCKRFGLDWFIIALIGMIVLASLWPEIGAQDSVIPFAQIANYGVSLIFFFYGLRLSKKKIISGINNWRLHLIVQFTTFVLFPLIVLGGSLLFANVEYKIIWLGIFFLACLPSTVSSSVVMVSIAKGNIPAAIFNASISTLIGVFVTPLLVGIFVQTSTGGFDMGPIMLKLTLQVLFPVILGILLNSKFGSFAEKHQKILGYFDQTVILLIVYSAFCESFAKEMFEGYSSLLLMALMAGMLVLLFIVLGMVFFTSVLLKFSRQDKITAAFCGSTKSLMHGTIMSKVLFAGSPFIGVILLPTMMYHALQLVAISIIAQRVTKKMNPDG